MIGNLIFTLSFSIQLNFRIGEGEKRSNVFLLEREMKQKLFGTKKPPSPVHQKQSFSSNMEVNNPPVIERLPVSTAALEHLDLPVTSASTVNSRIQCPGLFSSANSSTSSGISTDSTNNTMTTTPALRRQHYSFSQGCQQLLASAREM
jgi:hypothetical protein